MLLGKRLSRSILVLFSILLLLAISTSCLTIVLPEKDRSQLADSTEQSEESPSAETPAEEYVPPKMGELTTGPEFFHGTPNVPTNGANITINQPGNPLNGMLIQIPPNSYPSTTPFKVSSAPITGNTFQNVTPISPLITIDNGGGYAEELMTVKVPVQIPSGYFAMGFYYDKELGRLEGIPLVEETPTSVTIGTRHFCDFFISMIEEKLLLGKVDSGYKPGVDDWQFDNNCSYIKPGGHCAGQSITSMWYYCTKPDGAKAHLYGRYDNYGHGKPTPDFWQDDNYAYRLCSVVQKSMKWDEDVTTYIKFKLVPDELTLKAFAYAMKATGEPQFVGIYSNAGGGHAMVVYRVDNGNDGALWVADPNYHSKQDRFIEYHNGTFTPYNSGANAQEIAKWNGQKFETIRYFGKSARFDWPLIGDKWQEMKNKTIGNDVFPAYKIGYKDKENKFLELIDGASVSDSKLRICAELPTSYNYSTIFRNGIGLVRDRNGCIELNSGKNVIGIPVGEKPPGRGSFEYVDFQYITVYVEFGAKVPTTPHKHPIVNSISGPTGRIKKETSTPYQYSINVSGGTPPYTIEWRGNNVIHSGTGKETVTIMSWDLRNNGQGDWVFITVKDSAGQDAVWLDDAGIPKYEFTYGVITATGAVVTEPKTFPYRLPSGK